MNCSVPENITIEISADNTLATVRFAFLTPFTPECTYSYMVEFLDGNNDFVSGFTSVLNQTELTAGQFVITPACLLVGLQEFEPGVGINVTLSVGEDSSSAFANVPGGKMAVSDKQM